jgi:aryl-alcohol dehydrogenase-like predicted oxidoreductase
MLIFLSNVISTTYGNSTMTTRQLGTNGPLLTEIGFGAWAIGGAWKFGWGKTDDNESMSAINKALDLGINWIDTAAAYGLGHSEEVVGKAIKGQRNKVFVATKCAQVWDASGNVRTYLGVDSMRKEIEASLRRLQTDYIDLYQIHWPDPSTPIEESWNQMLQFRKEGKVKYIGVCNLGMDLLERCETIAQVQSLQPIYNLLERGIEQEILPYCKAKGIGIVAYSPMQSGLLTGSFDFAKLQPDDWRIVHSEKFREPKLSRGLTLAEKLRPLAARYNKTVGQLAVNWVLRNEAITSAIVGVRRAEQVEQNVGSIGWEIRTEDMEAIRTMLS